MLRVNGFACILILDSVKQDHSRYTYQSPSHVTFVISSPIRAGMTWTLAWKDERLEREPSVGAVWLREAKDEGPRVVCAGVRLRSEDIAWPTAKGEFTSDRPAVELRLVIAGVGVDGETDPRPFAIFSFAITSASAQLGHSSPYAGEQRTYGSASNASTTYRPSAFASMPIVGPRFAAQGVILPTHGPSRSSSCSPTNSLRQQPHTPASCNIEIALLEARQTEHELEKKLRIEQDTATFYEESVQILYQRLTPRQLVKYLDHRLMTEVLSPPMRASVAGSKAEAIELVRREEQAAVEEEVAEVLKVVRSSSGFAGQSRVEVS